MQGPKKRLELKKTEWVKELPGILMRYQTLVCTPIGQISFSLIYCAEAILSVERVIPTLRVKYYKQGKNEELL